MSGMIVLDTYGEFDHLFNQVDVWCLILFFTFSYIMIDIGLQMVSSEIRYYMEIRREEIARQKRKKVRSD